MADYLKWGIHVMVSQNETGELTIGSSHEYGLVFDPFDKQLHQPRLIIDYLKKFASFNNWQMMQSWHMASIQKEPMEKQNLFIIRSKA